MARSRVVCYVGKLYMLHARREMLPDGRGLIEHQVVLPQQVPSSSRPEQRLDLKHLFRQSETNELCGHRTVCAMKEAVSRKTALPMSGCRKPSNSSCRQRHSGDRRHLYNRYLLMKETTATERRSTMTLAEPIPEKSIVMVGNEQGTIVRIHHGGRSYEVAFSNPSQSRTVLAREITAVIQVPPGSS